MRVFFCASVFIKKFGSEHFNVFRDIQHLAITANA